MRESRWITMIEKENINPCVRVKDNKDFDDKWKLGIK